MTDTRLRDKGVYALARGRHRELYVALRNTEDDGAYAFALAPAIQSDPLAFTWDSVFDLFVEVDEDTLFSPIAGHRHNGRRLSLLVDTLHTATGPHR